MPDDTQATPPVAADPAAAPTDVTMQDAVEATDNVMNNDVPSLSNEATDQATPAADLDANLEAAGDTVTGTPAPEAPAADATPAPAAPAAAPEVPVPAPETPAPTDPPAAA